jgi:hypothetical protein
MLTCQMTYLPVVEEVVPKREVARATQVVLKKGDQMDSTSSFQKTKRRELLKRKRFKPKLSALVQRMMMKIMIVTLKLSGVNGEKTA